MGLSVSVPSPKIILRNRRRFIMTHDTKDEGVGCVVRALLYCTVRGMCECSIVVVHCRAHQIPLLMIGSAGGQIDPTRIAIVDLSRTEQEPLLARVRKRLRAHHGFPRGTKNKFGVDAVYSTEPLRHPELCATDEDALGITGFNCAGYGSAAVGTASFRFVGTRFGLRKLAEKAGLEVRVCEVVAKEKRPPHFEVMSLIAHKPGTKTAASERKRG